MTDRQRRFDRIPIESLRGKLHTPRDLKVRDLSRTGMAFDTDEPLEEGKDYFVELTHRGQVVKLAVNVRWVRREESGGGEPPRYHVGVEFVDVIERPPTGIWDWVRVVGEEAGPSEDEQGWPP
ncbi:MAG: PilZ domain-containing protein [Acidobacteriota bacterium]